MGRAGGRETSGRAESRSSKRVMNPVKASDRSSDYQTSRRCTGQRASSNGSVTIAITSSIPVELSVPPSNCNLTQPPRSHPSCLRHPAHLLATVPLASRNSTPFSCLHARERANQASYLSTSAQLQPAATALASPPP